MNKPEPADAAFLRLPDHHVLALHGRDAIAFAQAQLMNDIAALGDGDWQWNGWLTPKGRVIALFAVLRVDAETLWLLLPDANAADIAARLARFVFRSKVAVTVREELQVEGAFARPARAAMAHADIAPDMTELDVGARAGSRTLRVVSRGDGQVDMDHPARWKAFDLAHGWPRLQDDLQEQWTPQQLSLDRLQAYSVRKGCYPGQEIVARTHFLGQTKRGLALLTSPGAIVAGESVMQAERALGQVVSSVPIAAGSIALAVLPLDHLPDGLSVPSGVVSVRGLEDGLHR